jgi:hypothetical protein
LWNLANSSDEKRSLKVAPGFKNILVKTISALAAVKRLNIYIALERFLFAFNILYINKKNINFSLFFKNTFIFIPFTERHFRTTIIIPIV